MVDCLEMALMLRPYASPDPCWGDEARRLSMSKLPPSINERGECCLTTGDRGERVNVWQPI